MPSWELSWATGALIERDLLLRRISAVFRFSFCSSRICPGPCLLVKRKRRPMVAVFASASGSGCSCLVLLCSVGLGKRHAEVKCTKEATSLV